MLVRCSEHLPVTDSDGPTEIVNIMKGALESFLRKRLDLFYDLRRERTFISLIYLGNAQIFHWSTEEFQFYFTCLRRKCILSARFLNRFFFFLSSNELIN